MGFVRRLFYRFRRYPRTVVFFIGLPDPLPLPHGSTFSSVLGVPVPALRGLAWAPTVDVPAFPEHFQNQLFVSVRIWQVKSRPWTPSDYYPEVFKVVETVVPAAVSRRFERGEAEEASQDTRLDELSETYVTVVEAVTLLFRKDGNDPLSAAFDRCLDFVRELYRAYRLASGDLVPAVSYERLPAAIPWISHSLTAANSWDKSMSLMLLHFNVPTSPEIADAAALEQISGHLSLMKRDHPLTPFSERSLEARRALQVEGDYGRAVVEAQTSTEVLFDATLLLLLWEEDADPVAAAKFFDEGLAKRVRTHLPPRLGGNWAFRGRGAIGEWANDLAPLRHRVVHAALQPTKDQAHAALDAAAAVEVFVKERLVAKRTTYPRTTLLVLGRPGLERSGAWSGEIRRFAEEEADREPDWVATFRGWRTKVDAARRG
jgi:hypothetical protein